MKRASKIAIAVGLALGLGAAVVVAQPMGWGGGPGMMGGGMMGWGGGYGYNAEERLAAQKAALKITPKQESAWSAYADATKKQFDSMAAQREAMWKAAPSSTAERYELHSKFMTQRAAQFDAMSTAYKNLDAVLTPEQRAVFDSRAGFGPAGRGPGWHYR